MLRASHQPASSRWQPSAALKTLRRELCFQRVASALRLLDGELLSAPQRLRLIHLLGCPFARYGRRCCRLPAASDRRSSASRAPSVPAPETASLQHIRRPPALPRRSADPTGSIMGSRTAASGLPPRQSRTGGRVVPELPLSWLCGRSRRGGHWQRPTAP